MNEYHFIGIGGIGMSALARILLETGCRVKGSDAASSPLIEELKTQGAIVAIGHNAEMMQESIVVYNSEINEKNVEFAHAKKKGLPLMHRSDLLDQLMRSKLPLLVTGTHGKTTTTSLLASVFLEAGLDPSFVVGGIVQALKTNGRFGKGNYFIAEADESDGSFLKTPAFGAIVTNCDNDHLNYWETPARLEEGFRSFFSKVLSPEYLFWCRDDPRLASLHPRGFSYGFSKDADWIISNYRTQTLGIVFDLAFRGMEYKDIKVSLFGNHNALNASAVFALCSALKVEESAIRKCFAQFGGVKRRLEWKGEVDQVACYDDYGHHPTEIQTTIRALKERIGKKELVVVFQPHRFSRTQNLWNEFVSCFQAADVLFLTDIYPVSEMPIPGITGEHLKKEIQKNFPGKIYFCCKSDLIDAVANVLKPGQILLTIGAGDITKMGPLILEAYLKVVK